MITHPLSEPFKILDTLPGYRAHYRDIALWAPAIRAVCTETGLTCRQIRQGAAGTFPVFVMDDRWVIKFFGPLFDGSSAFEVETAVSDSLAAQPDLPLVRVLHLGSVPGAERGWRYLVYPFVQGRSFGEDRGRIAADNQAALARRLGEILRRFHHLPAPAQPAYVFTTDWNVYLAKLRGWFSARLHAADQHSYAGLGLPDHLAAEAGEYLARYASPSGQSRLHLIHADLTADHVLGEFGGGQWRINGIIDMGDCMTGDLFYELVALYLDLFNAQKPLLAAFLEGYGAALHTRSDFPRRCLCAALQHQFNVFTPLFEAYPALAHSPTLDHLAQSVWGLSSSLSPLAG